MLPPRFGWVNVPSGFAGVTFGTGAAYYSLRLLGGKRLIN
jgi:hypothetical protein